MKDSQLGWLWLEIAGKYIKANNERFSTPPGSVARCLISISKANNERFSTTPSRPVIAY